MNTPVNFELAKLLNDKGLPGMKSFYDSEKHYDLNSKKYTIADVIMWLYEKYEVWIWVSMELGYRITFCWQLTGESTSSNYKANFKTPTEAYEGAIEYVLTNLI